MKIAIWHNTGAGGARRHLYSHVAGLLKRGHLVRSWCLSSADQTFLPLSELVPERVVPVHIPDPDRGPLLQRVLARKNEARDLVRSVSKASRQCAAEMSAEGFDVLFALNCRLTIAAPLSLYVNIPSVLYLPEPRRTFYEALPTLPWVGESLSRGSGQGRPSLRKIIRDLVDFRNMRYLARYEREAVAGYNLILVNSLFSRESVLRAYGVDSRVCYIGIDLTEFRPLGLAREDMVLGVGTYSFHKNIPFAIAAVAAMPMPRPRLVWVGNGGPRETLRELGGYAASLGVSFEPRFGVRDEELLDLYNRAKALLFAPRLEPFGLAALEASACGLPVVAVAEGGLRETVRDGVNGFLVEHDPQAVAAALQRLMVDDALRKELGRRGREFMEREWGLEQSTVRLEQWLARVTTKTLPS